METNGANRTRGFNAPVIEPRPVQPAPLPPPAPAGARDPICRVHGWRQTYIGLRYFESYGRAVHAWGCVYPGCSLISTDPNLP